MRGEQVVLDHDAAVCYAVEEGLGPVPRGMEADGPPERAGAPETEAKDEADEACGQQADGRLFGIFAVSETEADGEEQRAGPEAEPLGGAGLEEPRINTGEATGEGKEQVTAGEILFEQRDHEEAQEPERAVAKGRAAGEQATVEYEQASA